MPPKKYTNLSISVETRAELDKLREETGISSLDDLLIHMIKIYRDHMSLLNRLEDIIINAVNKALSNITTAPTNVVSKEDEAIGSPLTNVVSKEVANEEIDEDIEKVFKTIDTEKLVQKPITEIPRVFCVRKKDIKDLDKYIKFLKEDGVYIAHWDEYDKYCFKIKDIYKE